MAWYIWLALVSLSICLLSCIFHFYRIIRLGNPPEYARRAGHIGKAIRYSFTGAMSPRVKESAYLHMPTYLAGILYHLGTFLAIFLFILSLFNIWLTDWAKWTSVVLLIISGSCGIAVLLKRIISPQLRALSNPDDYISNSLVTAFHLFTIAALVAPQYIPAYFVVVSMLMLYFPLGKLKHAVYFFAARYHLAYFYGWRGVWPPKPIKK